MVAPPRRGRGGGGGPAAVVAHAHKGGGCKGGVTPEAKRGRYWYKSHVVVVVCG